MSLGKLRRKVWVEGERFQNQLYFLPLFFWSTSYLKYEADRIFGLFDCLFLFVCLRACFKEGGYYGNSPANFRASPESQQLRCLGLLK